MKAQYVKKKKVGKRTSSMIQIMESADVQWVLRRIEFEQQALFRIAADIYTIFTLQNRLSRISLRNFCMILAADLKGISWRFLQNLYLVHRHFVSYCGMSARELVGLDWQALRGIVDAGFSIFDVAMTTRMVREINSQYIPKRRQRKYVRSVRDYLKNGGSKLLCPFDSSTIYKK